MREQATDILSHATDTGPPALDHSSAVAIEEQGRPRSPENLGDY
jgi:hypothetical protein